ncbi:MAG TPA: phage tail sheath subtilisin-like domain-containing protein [Blastocatellia bacterium]|nr:phage tail sheath subtilisin-like domain-containing protein [Blastocatellia bacterium]
MATYLSPGVYVEEVPSAVKAIAGVGTSTAGLIGVAPDTLPQPLSRVTEEAIGTGDAKVKVFELDVFPVVTDAGSFQMRVDGVAVASGVTLSNDTAKGVSKVTFGTAPADKGVITGDYTPAFSPVAAGDVKLCTNFGEFKKFFGDFSGNKDHNYLAHAVYGFFNNGGTRCYVMRVAQSADIPKFLPKFEAIDEIAIVAAPGITDKANRSEIDTHCRIKTQDRFAIFDSPEVVETSNALDTTLLTSSNTSNVLPPNSDYAAFYFPWIQVFDPVTKQNNPSGDGSIFVPPSGHLAGVYARVDTDRGVHKAPANEVVMGALGLKYRLSKAQQDGLNPQGVNCIRDLNGNIRVWGARTAGGDANADLKYINVRRTLLFLRESIDEGTQWVVFEPNSQALWQKITRNVSAFLTNVWRSGALFGNTPQEAFYVKCDAETNPPELREVGQVVTEIGVAIVRPAEFVIFRISQMAQPSK